jgi:hypothetical protein
MSFNQRRPETGGVFLKGKPLALISTRALLFGRLVKSKGYIRQL